MWVLRLNRQRKAAVFLWGLCLLSIFLPTSRLGFFMGHFYETSVVATLLWYSLPLAMIWLGSGLSEMTSLDTSFGPAIKQGFGILLVAVGWGGFVLLIGRRVIGPLIFNLSR
jgi:hypothetical protein